MSGLQAEPTATPAAGGGDHAGRDVDIQIDPAALQKSPASDAAAAAAADLELTTDTGAQRDDLPVQPGNS